MQTTQVAVDLAESVFQVAVSHAPGRVDKQQRLSRQRFRTFFLHHPPAHVLMEACGSAHHWRRELQTLGHEVSLLPPSHVARYRQGNKTDRADAKALLEAARNEDITPVPVKSLDQQAINALHRLRSAYLGLTPRESSSGGARRLGPISKRGNRYLRVLLIHGARAALLAAHRTQEPDDLQTWAIRTAQARGHDIATFALANRMARIAWRVWRDQRPFQRRFTAQEDAA